MLKRLLIKVLLQTINSLEDNLKAEKRKVTERDNLLKFYQEKYVELSDFKNRVVKVLDNSGTMNSKYDKIKELVDNLQRVD